MEFLKSKDIEVNPEYNQSATGRGVISRFDSYQFGATFSRVVEIIHLSTDVITNPVTGKLAVLLPKERIKNTIVLGRLCQYPNKIRTFWQSLQEGRVSKRSDETIPAGSNPFIGVQFEGFYLDFLDYNDAPSGKVVIQLLFIEL